MTNLETRTALVRLLALDVDGVLTDGSLFFGDDGEEYKAFHARDGQGMAMLREAGVEIGVISGRTSRAVTHRMSSLHVSHVYQGQQDKLAAFEELLEFDYNLWDEIRSIRSRNSLGRNRSAFRRQTLGSGSCASRRRIASSGATVKIQLRRPIP